MCEDEEESKNRSVEVCWPLNSHVRKKGPDPVAQPYQHTSQTLRPCSAHCVPNGISFASLVVRILAGEVASLFGQDSAAPERRKNGNEDEVAGKRNGEKYLLHILEMRKSETHTHANPKKKKQKKHKPYRPAGQCLDWLNADGRV